MMITGLGGVVGSGGLGSLSSLASPAQVISEPFGGIFKSLVADTSDLSKKAEAAVSSLLRGDGVDVHEALIATQKADVAFELALQLRNKAVGAYQTMMGMQF